MATRSVIRWWRGSAPRTRPTSALVAGALAVGVLVVACSSDDGGEGSADRSSPAAATTDPSTTSTTSSPDTGSDDAAATTSSTAVGSATAPAATVETVEATVPDTGVPGLDSDVVVCQAWSRFAGSYQVVAVAAAFGDDPAEVARLEVAAAPVVARAYDDMVDNWPDELAAEADVVADQYLGAYARRSARALDALVAAGADDDTLELVATAWLDALAARDPAEVLPMLVLPDDVVDVVDAAVADFDAQVVAIPADPSLVTDADVPLTEAFLFDTCPDRGTLGGAEVG